MTVLRSRDNPRVRRWHLLVRDARLRRSEGRAWLEGPHLVGEYLARVGAPVALVVDEARRGVPEIARLAAAAGGAPCAVTSAVFSHLAETRSPAGIAAEIAIPVALPPPAAERDQWLFLEGIQDPGNLGTLLRSAAAFSAREAVLGPGCADPWSPRTLRAALGAHFVLPIREARDLAAELAGFAGLRACTVAAGGVPLPELPLRGPTAWIFGNEGQGVSAALRALADREVTIPMRGDTESVNVAVAASICLYEAARRRRPGGAPQKA